MATTAFPVSGQAMTVGSVVSRALAVVRGAPALFFGAGFLLVALPSVLTGIAMRSVPRPVAPGVNPFALNWPALVGGGLLYLLFYLIGHAVLIRAAVIESERRQETIGGYASAAARTLPPLIILTILMAVSIWFGMVLLLVPGVILLLMWSVATPALIVERIGVFAAFGRSRYLTNGARWRILGLFLLVWGIYFAVSAVWGIGTVATRGMSGLMAARTAPSLPAILVSLALQTVFAALFSAIQGSLYIELRDWKDGHGSERLADIFA